MADDVNGCCYKCLTIISYIISFAFLIASIIFNILCFKSNPFNDELYEEKILNWKKIPIVSISINDNILYKFNRKIKKSDLGDIAKMFKIERMDKKFDYQYLLKEDVGDKEFHPCGTDKLNNYLFLPKDIDCPINGIEITNSSIPSKNEYDYTTVKIYDNLYLHYTNNNIDGRIINDFFLYCYEEYIYSIIGYNEFRVDSTQLPLLELNQELSFLIDFYKGYNCKYSVGYEKRDLSKFKYFINGKYYRKLINFISLIILIVVFIFLIFTFISDKFEGLHLLNLFLLLIDIYIEIILNYYVYNNEIAIVADLFLDSKEYNLKQLSLVIVFTILYQISNTFHYPLSNYYYYLIYPFRYGFTCELFNKCQKSQKEKNLLIINKIDNELNNLNNKLSEINKEKVKLSEYNFKILSVIEKKRDFLLKLKESLISEIEVNICLEENFYVKFENELDDLKKNKKNEIDILNNLQKEIDETENKIKYFQMKKFNEQILNKPIIY